MAVRSASSSSSSSRTAAKHHVELLHVMWTVTLFKIVAGRVIRGVERYISTKMQLIVAALSWFTLMTLQGLYSYINFPRSEFCWGLAQSYRKLRYLRHHVETLYSVLRKTFGPKWEEVTGGCRKLHKEEFRGVSLSPNITRMIQSGRWTGHVARMGGQRNEQRVLVGRREGPEEKNWLLLPTRSVLHLVA